MTDQVRKEFAVRRARLVLCLKESRLREARLQFARRSINPTAFSPEEIELADEAVKQAEFERDLAALDLEEVKAL